MPDDPFDSDKPIEPPKKRFGDNLPQSIKDRMGPEAFERMVQQVEAEVAAYNLKVRMKKKR